MKASHWEIFASAMQYQNVSLIRRVDSIKVEITKKQRYTNKLNEFFKIFFATKL